MLADGSPAVIAELTHALAKLPVRPRDGGALDGGDAAKQLLHSFLPGRGFGFPTKNER